jgi:hypothetical protein
MTTGTLPPKQGLYDPANEHDACGVGFVANVKGRKSHEIVQQGLRILRPTVTVSACCSCHNRMQPAVIANS